MSELCWSEIGVRGDGSCPELIERVHCRNCPVYSAASLALLDREPPAERSVRLSASVDARAQGLTHSAIVFRLAQEWLSLPMSSCREVGRRGRIHPLPDRSREDILGVTNVNGELLVCFSLHRILELGHEETADASRTGRFLILDQAEGGIVCPVDEAGGVARYRESELAPAPPRLGNSGRSYVRGVLAWQERSVGILDQALLRFSFAGGFTSTPT